MVPPHIDKHTHSYHDNGCIKEEEEEWKSNQRFGFSLNGLVVQFSLFKFQIFLRVWFKLVWV